MSADDTFLCPGCGTTLQIPAQLYVEREIKRSGGPVVKISSDDSPARQPLPCPRCGIAIPIDHILNPPPIAGWFSSLLGCAVIMGVLVAIIVLANKGC
jgi:hypothetical protein